VSVGLEQSLNGVEKGGAMNEQSHISEDLVDEITRYLAAVDAFRDAGCEPTWRPEPTFADALSGRDALVRHSREVTLGT
jgi:hypothetical protein